MEPRNFDVAGLLHLRMRIRSGDIRIRQTDLTTATVHITGERQGEEISVEIDGSPSGTRLQVVQPRGGGGWGVRGGTLQVDVEVPQGTVSEIATGSGDLIVDGTLGELEFQSGSGDVEIGSIRGALHGRSASGDITIGDLSGDGQATSASGDITIGSASADLALRSVSGDIEVGVPQGMRVWFDLSSTSGDTLSELEPGGTGDDREGASAIRATTVSGDVRIRRAPARDSTPV